MKFKVLTLIGMLAAGSGSAAVVFVDNFALSPAVQYNVDPTTSSSVTTSDASVLGGTRQVSVANPLPKSSAFLIQLFGFDPNTFNLAYGGPANYFAFSAPKNLVPVALSLTYPNVGNLQSPNQEVFKITIQDIDLAASVTLTVTDSSGGVSSATSAVSPGASVIQVPFASFTGNASFSSAASLVVTFNITTSTDMALSSIVTDGPPVPNVCPETQPDTIDVAKGGTVNRLANGGTTVIANDSDPDGSFLATSLVIPPTHGTARISADGTFVYIHNGNGATSDAFTYQILDADGCPALGLVTVTIRQNECPVVVGESIEVVAGGVVMSLPSLETSLLNNDSDPDNDRLYIELLTAPSHGTVTINANGTFQYTHDGGESLTDMFSYMVRDRSNPSLGCAVPGVVNVSVVPCSECLGKISQLTFLYQGSTSVRLAATCVNGGGRNNTTAMVYNGIVQPGQVFVVDNSANTDYREGFIGTLGTELKFVVNGVALTNSLHTSCSVPVGFGTIYGDFMVVAGYSKLGGAICPLE